MRYRELGNTGLQVSEIGLGAEWLERHTEEEVKAVIQRCESYGINILDCWMSNPEVRTKIGNAICGHREKWVIQGHFGSTWQGGAVCPYPGPAQGERGFSGFAHPAANRLHRPGNDPLCGQRGRVPPGDGGEFLAYVKEQKAKGVIRHIGIDHLTLTGESCVFIAGEEYCPVEDIQLEALDLTMEQQAPSPAVCLTNSLRPAPV